MMKNFLDETLKTIEDCGKAIEDVAWVGSNDGEYSMSWDEFKKIIDIEYDNGYGGQRIATDLVIVFIDGTWLYRAEYDGAEWWEYAHIPYRKLQAKPFKHVTGDDSWGSLDDYNNSEGQDEDK